MNNSHSRTSNLSSAGGTASGHGARGSSSRNKRFSFLKSSHSRNGDYSTNGVSISGDGRPPLAKSRCHSATSRKTESEIDCFDLPAVVTNAIESIFRILHH